MGLSLALLCNFSYSRPVFFGLPGFGPRVQPLQSEGEKRELRINDSNFILRQADKLSLLRRTWANASLIRPDL